VMRDSAWFSQRPKNHDAAEKRHRQTDVRRRLR
jgi:hypothetical protein